MRIGKLLAASAFLFAATVGAQVPTQVFVPESGFYWDPTESGRGFAIEIQDRTLFMAAYVYSESNEASAGEPRWYTTSGDITVSGQGDNTQYEFLGTLFFSEDGQALGETYIEPITTDTGIPVDITFSSATRATMFIDGEQINLQRFWYSPSIQDANLAMLGQWIIVGDCTSVSGPNDCFESDFNLQPFQGDLLEIFDRNTSGGQTTADGFRPGTNIDVSGAYDPNDDFYVIIVAEQQGQFLAYYFFGNDFGTNEFRGLAERYQPGTNISGDGYPAYGYRLSDRTFAEQLNGIGAKAKANAGMRPAPKHDRSVRDGLDEAMQTKLNAMVRLLESRVNQ